MTHDPDSFSVGSEPRPVERRGVTFHPSALILPKETPCRLAQHGASSCYVASLLGFGRVWQNVHFAAVALEEPGPHMVRHCPEPFIADPFPVDRAHVITLRGMAHDLVTRCLSIGLTADGLHRVANCEET